MPDPVTVPSWSPGWHEPGDVVRFAGRRWKCIQRTAGRPSDRSPAWEPLD
jgi:hypothetical protein